MGSKVVRKESVKKPGAPTRLWSYEDIRQVLEENTGIDNVEGIKVDLPEGHYHDMIRLSPKAFAEMKRLGFFISRGACFSGGVLSYLSNELRVLDWSNCHLQSLPSNFHGEKLVVFRMYQGCIKEIISRKFKSLTVMQFFVCKFLTKIPDLSSCSNLEKLDIVACENLVEVHASVGFLDKLDDLYLNGCPSLKSFPRHVKLRSLRYLTLLSCSKHQNFPPQIECKMELLSSIDLEALQYKNGLHPILGTSLLCLIRYL
ncbi:TMV resistance protein N-like [Juglans microcarpa x Juglans regia]|uniref:TMV resistance protein N-like n=1 Tax=Juglans microcarpa x Juglans regia TaxID=2249226 RepID=UPI001B7EB283|nr:TMV resistance protein N-like [Juglans microcarpa x Juglans regia]